MNHNELRDWEKEFDKLDTRRASTIKSFFHQKLLSLLDADIQEMEEMKEVRWIEHGMDCEEGRRPCGGVERLEKLADRCEIHSFDTKTLSTLIQRKKDLRETLEANQTKE